MCGLFGFTIYNENIKDYSKLLNALSVNASVRGLHATGIAYNYHNNLAVFKRPFPADMMDFKHLDGVRAIIGHTRHATQGKQANNYNNHPFKAKAGGSFALAHNGIIYNDAELKRTERLPTTKIKTDSYIMCQLLEKEGLLDFRTLASCTEKLEGYFTFTILDEHNNLYIVKGDSPLSIIRLTELKMIVYASTDDILINALTEAGLINEIINKRFERISVEEGEILKITEQGEIERATYNIPEYSRTSLLNWYDYNTPCEPSNDYVEDLLTVAKLQGYDEEMIFELLYDGWSVDDIEDYLYSNDWGDAYCLS